MKSLPNNAKLFLFPLCFVILHQAHADTDVTDLVPAFNEHYGRQVQYLEHVLKEYKKALADIKKDPSAINKDAYYGLVQNLFGYVSSDVGMVDAEVAQLIPKKYRTRISRLKSVDDDLFKEIKDFSNLKELDFGEFFNFEGELLLKKGMLPLGLEKLRFYDADSTTVESGALPKSLREVVCGYETVIKGPLPAHIWFRNCNPKDWPPREE